MEHVPDGNVVYVPQGISDRLLEYEGIINEIERQHLEDKESGFANNRPDPTTRNYIRYADDLVKLKAEFSRSFFVDFAKWVGFYDRNKEVVRNRFEEIKAGQVVAPEVQQRVINQLDLALTEAIEAIVLTRTLTQSMLTVLGYELERLRALDMTGTDETAQISYQSHVGTVSIALLLLASFMPSC